jgi:hypothetical protein
MQTPLSLLPDSATLTARLTAAFGSNGSGTLEILARKRPRYMSTFPNEIVTCQSPDGVQRRLFCKYEAGLAHGSFGHRGGLAYEAGVYRHVLHPLRAFRPGFVGAHTDGAQAGTWLILEYLDRCTLLKDIRVRLKGISQPVAMVLAARWLGQFHRAQQTRLADGPVSFLKRYDADYYLGWARRTCQFARPLRRRFPWLAKLGRRGGKMFAPLLAAPPTVIHGEFYINNILVRRKRIFPIDWESTAIAPGEIDLAALIEGPWQPRLVQRCVRAYQRTRWPDAPPADFARVLDTARLYLYFRWLGERPDWTLREKTLWRFDDLRATASRLGLL